MKIKSFTIVNILVALFIMADNTLVLAANEQLYDKGRSYSYIFANSTAPSSYSTVVISDSAMYYNSQGWGRERIRLWSRLGTVDKIYPYPYSNSVSQMELRFASTNNSMLINATDPVTNMNSPFTVPGLAYDILSYMNLPSNFIGDIVVAFVNSVNTKGTKVTQNTSYDYTVTFYSPDYNIVDLPLSISYKDADVQVGSNYSGADAKFQYNLPSNLYNYTVYAKGRILYATWVPSDQGGGLVYNWTGFTQIQHVVNSK